MTKEVFIYTPKNPQETYVHSIWITLDYKKQAQRTQGEATISSDLGCNDEITQKTSALRVRRKPQAGNDSGALGLKRGAQSWIGVVKRYLT